MAAINEEIQKISPYFKAFNIADDNAFLLINFPEKWKVFDEEALNKEFDVYTGQKPEGLYFITPITNGTDCLFEAVNYVISVNKALEEKQRLLQEKAQELTNLFINEPLEKLKTLEFTFREPKKQRTVKTVKKVEVPTIEPVVVPQIEEKPIVVEEPKKKTTKKATKKVENNDDSDTMSFMKELIGDE